MIPRIESRGRVKQLIVGGRPFLMLAGELHNSSASSADDMAASFARLRALNLNTIIAPVSWELVEPEEGRFDFGLVDAMLETARRHGLRLVLLWFGTWKNGKSCYTPAWVKTDPRRFPRVATRDGRRTDVMSPFHEAIGQADARAFAAVMRHVHGQDKEPNTVLMVQIENEVGILGQPRDFSAAAEQAFAGPVPTRLPAYLQAHERELLAAIRDPWVAAGRRSRGTWSEVFGLAADEVFMAWHLAGHLEAVAAAGSAEHGVPMYANAWLKQPNMMHAGQYPSGGPISDMLDVWRAAAPHIAFLAPDIYVNDFKDVCASYTRSGNPLFIPESHGDARASGQALFAFGEHAAMGFGPFAVDDLAVDHPLGSTYAALAQVSDLVAAAQAEGRIFGFYQQDETDRSLHTVGPVCIHATSNYPRSKVAVPGGGLVVFTGEDELLAIGHNYWLEFSAPGAEVPDMEVLSVEEGKLEDGRFVPLRRLNGDENLHGQAVPLRNTLTVCRARLNLKAGPIRFRPEWQFPAG